MNMMKTIFGPRAATLIYRLCRSAEMPEGLIVVPANSCPIVPLSIANAGRQPLFIDIDPNKVGRQRRGLPILSPDMLPELWGGYKDPVLLAAVAARDARELIREHLVSIGLIEGVDWWAVA